MFDSVVWFIVAHRHTYTHTHQCRSQHRPSVRQVESKCALFSSIDWQHLCRTGIFALSDRNYKAEEDYMFLIQFEVIGATAVLPLCHQRIVWKIQKRFIPMYTHFLYMDAGCARSLGSNNLQTLKLIAHRIDKINRIMARCPQYTNNRGARVDAVHFSANTKKAKTRKQNARQTATQIQNPKCKTKNWNEMNSARNQMNELARWWGEMVRSNW